jgi:hypothetical protein
MYAWAPWLSDLRQGADAMREFWRDTVLRFDSKKQDALLQSLGFAAPDASTLGLALAAALALSSLWIVWQTRRETAVRPLDQLGHRYAELQRRLARAGWARKIHEGPLAYAERVASARPDLADELQHLCAVYAELRYGEAPTQVQIDALSVAMAAFRVRAIKPKPQPQTAE